MTMQSKIDRQSIIKASSSQVSCRLGEETVVLQVDSGRYMGMDPVSTTIWEFIQQPRSFHELEAYLLEEYEVTPERCEADLLEVLEELLESGLIEVMNARPS